jgi:hypothetical protein
VWVFLGQAQEASANLSYRGIWEDNENDDGRLLQTTSHILAFNTRQAPTERLSSEENVNYIYRWEQEGGTREIVSPGASIRVNGDIVFANLSVNSTINQKSTSVQPDTDSLGFSLASSWRKRFYPKYIVNYDYNRQRIYGRIDDSRQSLGTEVNWDLLFAQFFYSFRRSESNFVSYQDSTDNNLLRVNVSRVWLDDRLQVSLGQEYNKTDQARQIPFITATSADVFLNLSRVDTGTDPIPNDTDDSMLVAAPFLLNDNNPRLPPAYTITAANNPNSIRLWTNGQKVDRIFLYTQADLTKLGANPLLGINIRVYSNNGLETTGNFLTSSWDQVAPFTWKYEPQEQRFVIDFPTAKVNYLKVVVDLAGTSTIDLTEVQALYVEHGALGTTLLSSSATQNDKSNVNLDFRLNKGVAFYYNFLIEKEKVDADKAKERESHNGGMRVQNSSGDLKSTFSYSLARRRYAAIPESQTETYMLSINQMLLPTLTLSLSGSRDNDSQEGTKISTRNRYAFYADAKLYPDLSSQLEVIYWDLKNFESQIGNQDNLNTKLTFTSRFSPSINVSLYDIYNVYNQAELSKKENTSGFMGTWQVSDLLSLYASVTMKSGNLIHDGYIYSGGLVAGMGSRLEIRVSYSLEKSEHSSQSGQASLRWSSAKYLFVEIGCNYADSDQTAPEHNNIYRMYSQVVVSFATL